ncbi:MAG: c-type cytochrome [Gemmatimonadaceae bacterium]
MMRAPGLLLAVALAAGLAWAAPGRAPGRAAAPSWTAVGRPAAAIGDDSTGKALFTENCQKCHGARGIPPKVIKQKFTRIPTMDAAFLAARSDDSVVTILTNGKSDVMVSWKSKLTVDEMKAIAAYIRTFAK